MNIICKNCIYFRVIPNAPIAVGECRAFPPTVLMVKVPVDNKGQPITSALQKQAGLTETPNAYFPTVIDDCYCGHHSPTPASLN